MNPLSKEEIAGIKGLRLGDFVEIPVMHQKDIEYVFFEVMPKLVAIAEDHAVLSQKIETDRPDLKLDSKQVQAFHSMAKQEIAIFHEMEHCFQFFRSAYQKKSRILSKIEEPIMEPDPIGKQIPKLILEPLELPKPVTIPWYTKLFRKLTGKR